MNDFITEEEKYIRLDKWNVDKKELASMALKEVSITSEDDLQLDFPKQRSIYYAQLGENIGYEINQCHPVLIVSKDSYNKTGTVLVAPISSGKIRNNKHILRCQYILYKNKYPFLNKDCVIKCDQIRCISIYRLLDKKGYVNADDWKKISSRIKSTFF